MGKALECVARNVTAKCNRNRKSSSPHSPSQKSGDSSDSRLKRAMKAIGHTLEATGRIAKLQNPRRKKTAKTDSTDESPKQPSSETTSPPSDPGDATQGQGPTPIVHLMEVHSVNPEFDRDLADLADLQVKALRHLNSPLGKERDPDGYVTIRDYQPVERHRLVRIDSLPHVEQNRHYENALYGATIPQVQAQYDLHCQRLEEIRKEAAEATQAVKREQRLGNIDYEVWHCMTSGLMMNGLAAIGDRARLALVEADMWFEVRNRARMNEHGVIRLLERCEDILKRSDPGFTAKPWRDTTQGPKRNRWADGERGWTGLKQGDST